MKLRAPVRVRDMTDLARSPLGHATTYAEQYDPALLFPVERAPLRAELGLPVPLPFRGVDLWTAYELSWLDTAGKPEVAIATFAVPAESPAIVESKSVKLYLTAFNQTRFAAGDDVASAISADLSTATGASVGVKLVAPSAFAALPHGELAGTWLDSLPLVEHDDAPAPQRLAASGPAVDETLCTRLFRSVCPVTGQPDYASVQIRYRGPKIDRDGPARVSRLVSPPSGISRALRRADLRRRLATMRAARAVRLCPLHAPRRARHQSVPRTRLRLAVRQRAHGAAVNAAR